MIADDDNTLYVLESTETSLEIALVHRGNECFRGVLDGRGFSRAILAIGDSGWDANGDSLEQVACTDEQLLDSEAFIAAREGYTDE